MYQGCKYLHLQIWCTTVLSSLRTLRHNVLTRVFSTMTIRLCINFASFLRHALSLSWVLSKQRNKKWQVTDVNEPFLQTSIVRFTVLCDEGSPPPPPPLNTDLSQAVRPFVKTCLTKVYPIRIHGAYRSRQQQFLFVRIFSEVFQLFYKFIYRKWLEDIEDVVEKFNFSKGPLKYKLKGSCAKPT